MVPVAERNLTTDRTLTGFEVSTFTHVARTHDVYRAGSGDGATLAGDYVRTLWRVLALVCVPGSIHYEIVPGLTREELLSRPTTLDSRGPGEMRDALRLTAAERLPA